ncbi:hypothetical protein RB195_012537 [Necator americanus]|uniref:Transmembrane protein TMEM132 C-terminal domain-containing protein n=1 Tax=Necator americanus TaxID=51031 RepID=A0ABR1DRC9_NECAM
MRAEISNDLIQTEANVQHGAKSPLESTMSEQQTGYVNRPEGEMDMMIGFFLMNGICVAFFLLFGLCVIFSCLRQRPKIFRKQQRVSKQTTPPPPAPKFKRIVSRAIRTGAIETVKTELEGGETSQEKKPAGVQADETQIQVHVIPPQGESSKQRKASSTIEVESEAEVYQKNSIVRQNLLGPLSFDDLYYT